MQFKSLTFDPIKDFRMVGVLGTVPMVAVVPPDSKFKSFAGLIAYAKANNNTLSFASPGVATLPHLAGELVNTEAGIKIAHVGYRGSSPALTDVPTLAETVLPNFDIVTWYGMWGPKDTPDAIITKLNKAMVEASRSPKVIKALRSQGSLPSAMTPQQAEAFNLAESARWIKVMKDANILPE